MCGSRDWDDVDAIFMALSGLLVEHHDLVVIEGGATGADRIANQWAVDTGGVLREQYLPDWDRNGKAAGPIRNKQMLDKGKPDLVLAFKDGFVGDYDRGHPGGTEDMVRRAKKAGVPVYVISHG